MLWLTSMFCMIHMCMVSWRADYSLITSPVLSIAVIYHLSINNENNSTPKLEAVVVHHFRSWKQLLIMFETLTLVPVFSRHKMLHSCPSNANVHLGDDRLAVEWKQWYIGSSVHMHVSNGNRRRRCIISRIVQATIRYLLVIRCWTSSSLVPNHFRMFAWTTMNTTVTRTQRYFVVLVAMCHAPFCHAPCHLARK